MYCPDRLGTRLAWRVTAECVAAVVIVGVQPGPEGELACWQQQPGAARVAAAAAATFIVHAVREAIYLSPGHGGEEPAAQ